MGSVETATGVTPATPVTSNALTLTSAPPPALPTASPAARMVVDAARSRFDKVTTLHFVLTINGQIFVDPAHTQRLTAADGDLARPDRFTLTAFVAAGALSAQVKFIQVADTSYLTNVVTGRWQVAPDGLSYDPRVLFDADNGATAIMGRIDNWTLMDTTMINGIMTRHVHGVSPAAVASTLVADTLQGDYVDVDVYIDGRNNDIVRFIVAEQPATAMDTTQTARWTLDLSKQNAAVVIEAPMIGATVRR